MIYTSKNSDLSSILGSTPDELEMKGRGSDRVLLVSVVMLMMIGSLSVYSAIAYFAQSYGQSAGTFITGHLMKLGIAFVVMLIVSKMDYHLLARLSKPMLLVSWGLLIFVMLYGETVFGARRSLTVGGFSFQPSSLAAVSLIMYLSTLIVRKQEYIKDLKRAFLPALLWIGITCMLIALEDFSSAALLLGISLAVLFVGRMHLMQIGLLILIGALGASGLILSSTERTARVEQYLTQIVTVQSDDIAQGEGYQAQQAQIAIAQGGIFGVGIGKSTQRDFLPAPYNDFIYAIIAEEYGLLGSGLVLLLFVIILFRGFVKIAAKAKDLLGLLMATGATLYITLYAFVNAAVAGGLFPVTGLPMPFVSYGGTGMIFAGVMTGILLNISKGVHPNNQPFYMG